MRSFTSGLCLVFCCLFLLNSLSVGDIVLDVSFDHIADDPDGLAADGQLCVDSSGNNYHGFYSSSGGIATTGPTGTAAIDTSENNTYVILRDDRTYTDHGEPEIDDPITTPTPYFILKSDKSYTFEALLKWESSSPDSTHGIMGTTNYSDQFWMRENNGYLQWALGNEGGLNANHFASDIDISALEADGKWHHLALVLDRTASEIRVYADYQLIYTDTNPNIALLGDVLSGTDDFRLGGYNTSSSARFDGVQDGYVITDEALGIGTFVLSGIDFEVLPTNPIPMDNEIGVDPNTIIQWTPGRTGTFTYDVYFGTDPENLSLESALQEQTYFDPLGMTELDWKTHYYWRIDLHDNGQINKGPLWDFTTIQPICSPKLSGDLSGDCVVDITDLIILIEHWLDQP